MAKRELQFERGKSGTYLFTKGSVEDTMLSESVAQSCRAPKHPAESHVFAKHIRPAGEESKPPHELPPSTQQNLGVQLDGLLQSSSHLGSDSSAVRRA